MSKRFFVAKAKNGYREYFTYEGTDFPTFEAPNPMDYEIFEITEEEYKAGTSGELEVLPLEEAKWYRISFSAKLTPDDLKAMKKCFFDAMNEAMEIYDLEGLEIKEA